MKKYTTTPRFSTDTGAFEQICAGLVHLRKKEAGDQQLVIKMHEGLVKVIAGQLRINRAFAAAR